MKKIIIIIICSCFVLFLFYKVLITSLESDTYYVSLRHVEYTLESYINQQGEFPNCEDDLISSKCIRIVEVALSDIDYYGYEYYFVNSYGRESWICFWRFKDYEIEYGVDIDKLIEQNGIVYEKETMTPFYFISAPNMFLHKSNYMYASSKVYHLLKEKSKEQLP